MDFVVEVSNPTNQKAWKSELGRTVACLELHIGYFGTVPAGVHGVEIQEDTVSVVLRPRLSTKGSRYWKCTYRESFDNRELSDIISTPIHCLGANEDENCRPPSCIFLRFEISEEIYGGYFVDGDRLTIEVLGPNIRPRSEFVFIYSNEEWVLNRESESDSVE